jgi:hypothetical protein
MDKYAEVSRNSLGETQTKMRKVTPKDEDYYLCGVDIREAENGFIVSCRYKMTEENRKKYAAKGCYDTYRDSSESVFPDHEKAIDFIAAEIRKLKPASS